MGKQSLRTGIIIALNEWTGRFFGSPHSTSTTALICKSRLQDQDAAMPVYGKKPLKISSWTIRPIPLKFSMIHLVWYFVQVFIWVDLDLFYDKVRFGHLGFSIENVKAIHFSETVAASDFKADILLIRMLTRGPEQGETHSVQAKDPCCSKINSAGFLEINFINATYKSLTLW